MSNILPLTLESLVALLLLLTILYCVRLNGQLKRLRSDETSMRATVAELMAATETAERAIAGLKATVREADQTLGERLRAAERYAEDIVQHTEAGAEVLNRLAQIANARGGQPAAPAKPATPDPNAIVAAAQAFADRARAPERRRRMTKWLRDFRLVPIVLIAVGCLFALKAMGLVFDGGYTLGQRLGRGETLVVTTMAASPSTPLRSQTAQLQLASEPQSNVRSWMQEMFNYPDVTGSSAASRADTSIVTGSVAAPKPAANTPASANQTAPPTAAPPQTRPAGAPAEPPRAVSQAERAILERLQDRRQELDARARELDLRETLVKAAEEKLEAKLAELKATEARITTGVQRRDEAELARLKGLITMYETMKPKDAAKIFDRLEMKVLLDVATQINPRRMSEIMALMTTEAAEKLTVELATRLSGAERPVNPADLPKIDGRPSGG